MNQNQIKSILTIASLCVMAVLDSSCSRFLELKSRNKYIAVRVSEDYNHSTKSVCADSHRIIPLGEGLVIEETVSSESFESETKGAIITTGGHNKINRSGRSFRIEGWLGTEADTTDHHFLSDSAEFSGSQWLLGKDTPWKSGISSTFWSVFVQEDGTHPEITWPGSAPTAEQLKTLYFTYSQPAPSATMNDAYVSRDFLVGYNNETRNIGADGSVSVEYGTGIASRENSMSVSFHHPLAALKFIIGNINGSAIPGNDEYVEIEKIELLGTASKGTFVATGSDATNISFTCTPSDTTTFAQTTTRSQITDGQFSLDNSEYIFFVIPQDLEDVNICITIKKRSKNYTYDASGNITDSTYTDLKTIRKKAILSGSWDSGKYYTYKLSPLVYFGGEVLTLDYNTIEVSDTNNIKVSEDGLSFYVDGRSSMNEWIAPLAVTGINIVKLTFTHTYANNSQGSYRRIWLENVVLNPAYVEGGTENKYIPDGTTTPQTDLVEEAKLLGYTQFWPDNHYDGYLGEATIDKKKWIATAYDRHMNDSGTFTDVTCTQFYYLGGRFSFIRVHFDYVGDTGHGAGKWTAKYPTFNIVSMVE